MVERHAIGKGEVNLEMPLLKLYHYKTVSHTKLSIINGSSLSTSTLGVHSWHNVVYLFFGENRLLQVRQWSLAGNSWL